MTLDEPACPLPGAGGLVRVRLDLGYDGTAFSGWAAQPGRRTVEGVLSSALAQILRTDEPMRLTVAGRTDAGVHARGQVVHADVPLTAWSALPGRSGSAPQKAALDRLGGVLPRDLVVHRAAPAPAGFDARFSATARRYLYRICDDPAALDPLRRSDTVVLRRQLDVAAMNEASLALLGLRDFAAFCRRRQGATTVRTLLAYSWARDADGTLSATVRADAFCHSMVRSLVGAAVRVGQGRRSAGWPTELLAAGVRGVQVMPPHGLSLEEVTYAPDAALAARAAQSRAVRSLALGTGPDPAHAAPSR